MKNRVPKDYQDKILVHSLPVFFLGLSIFYIVSGVSHHTCSKVIHIQQYNRLGGGHPCGWFCSGFLPLSSSESSTEGIARCPLLHTEPLVGYDLGFLFSPGPSLKECVLSRFESRWRDLRGIFKTHRSTNRMKDFSFHCF